jgi:hypothetical protein
VGYYEAEKVIGDVFGFPRVYPGVLEMKQEHSLPAQPLVIVRQRVDSCVDMDLCAPARELVLEVPLHLVEWRKRTAHLDEVHASRDGLVMLHS